MNPEEQKHENQTESRNAQESDGHDELDAVLKTLASIERESESEFADRVIEKIETSSNKSRLPLPVPTPIGCATTDAETGKTVASECADDVRSSLDVRLVDTTANATDVQPRLVTKQRPKNSRSFQRFVAVSAVAVGLLGGLFFGIWQLANPSSTEQRIAQGANRPDPQAVEKVNPINQPELINEVHQNQDLPANQNDAVGAGQREKKSDLQLVFNPLVDVNNQNLKPVGSDRTEETPPKDLVELNDNKLVNRKPDLDANDVKGKQKPIERDWQFAVKFDRHGIGKASINGDSLDNVVFHQNLEPVLKKIGVETSRRFQYLEDRLGDKLDGRIQIGNESFDFVDATSLLSTVDDVLEYVQGLDFEPKDATQFVNQRSRFVKGMSSRVMPPIAIQFMDANWLTPERDDFEFAFATPDEVEFVKTTLMHTEHMLHGMSRARQRWEKENDIEYEFPEVARSDNQSVTVLPIDADHFDEFVKTGKLFFPQGDENLDVQPMIQRMSGQDLKLAVRQFAKPVDLFRSQQEFETGRQFVASAQVDNNQLRQTQNYRELLEANQAMLRARPRDLKDQAQVDEYVSKQKRFERLRGEFNTLKRHSRVEPLKAILPKRPDLASLPLVMGDECLMDETDAQSMDHVSKTVGATLGRFDRFGSRDLANNDSWRYSLLKNEIHKSCDLENHTQALSTLDQVLQVDYPRLRVELIKALRESNSDVAMKRIASRAKFDLVSDVRVVATEALTDFPAEDVRRELMEGLKYPWAVAAMHSAEALVRLDDKDAVPELIQMLDEPNPRLPVANVDGEIFVHELASINHMKNCLLCHAPSQYEDDYGRATTPEFDRPVPQSYYGMKVPSLLSMPSTTGSVSPNGTSAYVRADVTYLTQDFSVIQEVKDPGPWPKNQRFDYVVRKRPVSKVEARQIAASVNANVDLNRQAIVFALERLTGKKSATDTRASWEKLVK
ncbi:MAG: HEAT repeat domain-containing protein [Planctomycetota bacterium]